MSLHTLKGFLDFVFADARSENPASQRLVVANWTRITEAFLLSSGYESWRDNQKLVLSVLLLNGSFVAFETLNFVFSSGSSTFGSISVLNWSLYHETCNVSSLKYDWNSAETISRCFMMQVLMLSDKLTLFIFRSLFNKGNGVVPPSRLSNDSPWAN